jgi:hypothetical protein
LLSCFTLSHIERYFARYPPEKELPHERETAPVL